MFLAIMGMQRYSFRYQWSKALLIEGYLSNLKSVSAKLWKKVNQLSIVYITSLCLPNGLVAILKKYSFRLVIFLNLAQHDNTGI